MGVSVIVREAVDETDMSAAAELLGEYRRAIGLDLSFQDFEREVEQLPGRYARPGGVILLAEAEGSAVGCVALRPFTRETCEMKRLYVRPRARGSGTGRLLAQKVISVARQLGYRKMLLDTMSNMREANRLYESLGFSKRAPYYDNPLPGAVYYELELLHPDGGRRESVGR